ncbi:MAG: TRAP transporter small permease [Negativicutes bacterium]
MKFLKLLDEKAEECFLVISFAIMTLILSWAVFSRYVLSDSVRWSEELVRYIFIWFVYIGSSYAIKQYAHISIDIGPLLFGPKANRIMQLVSAFIWLVFSISMMWVGTMHTANIFHYNQLAQATRIPMGLVYAALPVGMAMMSIRLVQMLRKIWVAKV